MEYWICFGDSAHGSLACGRPPEWKAARIVPLNDDLSVGDLSDLTDRTARLRGVCPWHDDPECGGESGDYIDRYFNETLPAFDAIGAGDRAVIWYGDNPAEVCGMLRTVHSLWTRGAAISLVHVGGRHKAADLPREKFTIACAETVGVITDSERLNRVLRHVPQPLLRVWYECSRRKARKNAGGEIEFRGVGDLNPEYVPYFYGKRRAVPACEAEKLAVRWEALVRENAPLRALQNGKPVSVPTDYYDAAILACVPGETVRAAMVIGNALVRLNVGDWLIFERIRALAAKGEIEIVQDGANYREMIVRRKK